MKTTDRGFPVNLNAERLVLGSILLDGSLYRAVAGVIQPDDFSLEVHRRIFQRMATMDSNQIAIDRVTLADEMMRHNELAACGGFNYLISLDDGLPQLPNVDAYTRIILDKSTLRKAIMACESLKLQCMQAEDGSAVVLQKAEEVIKALRDGQQEPRSWISVGEVISNYPGGIGSFLAPPTDKDAVPLPWTNLQRDTGGLHRGDMYVLAGRTSMGKTAEALQISLHAARHQAVVGYVSLEMNKEILVKRLLSVLSRVDLHRIITGRLSQEDRRALLRANEELASLPIWIDESRANSPSTIGTSLRKLIRKHPVSILVVDHIQLLRGRANSESRHLELSRMSHDLKTLAMEENITAVVLSQLSRLCEKENRRPSLSDLRECGAIEEDSDVVQFVHRPERYTKDSNAVAGAAEFILGKQRNGPVGVLRMLFQGQCQTFLEPMEDQPQHVSITSRLPYSA